MHMIITVATAPTVYGIETLHLLPSSWIQQVATAPTVYGIETHFSSYNTFRFTSSVATAPTVYGIETQISLTMDFLKSFVATAPTVYGIETRGVAGRQAVLESCNSTYRLRY